MKTRNVVTLSVLGTLVAVAGIGLLLTWLGLRDVEGRGAEQFVSLVESSMGKALVVPQTGLSQEEGAEMFVTVGHAVHVALEAVKISRLGTLPETSEGIQTVEPGDRLDAWNHPFCLARSGTRVAVISAGPGLKSFPGCRSVVALTGAQTDIARPKPLPVHRLPSGALVLVVDSKSFAP